MEMENIHDYSPSSYQDLKQAYSDYYGRDYSDPEIMDDYIGNSVLVMWTQIHEIIGNKENHICDEDRERLLRIQQKICTIANVIRYINND